MKQFLIGITGGIACGKSTVSNLLIKKGIPCIDYDQLSREVIEPHSVAWHQIIVKFGKEILNLDLTIDRRKLREIVFLNEAFLRSLENIIHPQLELLYQSKLNSSKFKYEEMIQVAVPLLYEFKMEKFFDRIVVVYSSIDLQLQRLMKRDNISKEEAIRTINLQMPLEEKLFKADYTINNSFSIQEIKHNIDRLVLDLKHDLLFKEA